MRLAILSLSLVLCLLVGCAIDRSKGPVPNGISGASFSGTALGNSDQLVFNANGTGTSQVCGAFTYSVSQMPSTANNNLGTMTLSFANSTSECPLQSGANTCQYALTGQSLILYYPDGYPDYWWSGQ